MNSREELNLHSLSVPPTFPLMLPFDAGGRSQKKQRQKGELNIQSKVTIHCKRNYSGG
jgi:hypothetical protein